MKKNNSCTRSQPIIQFMEVGTRGNLSYIGTILKISKDNIVSSSKITFKVCFQAHLASKVKRDAETIFLCNLKYCWDIIAFQKEKKEENT